MKQNDKWLRAKRLVAVISAILLWLVSIKFSYDGFKFQATQMLWFGIVLSLIVTIVELVFNTRISHLNPTLVVAGILCYFYGVYTNVTGFYSLQGGTAETLWHQTNWLFPLFVGSISEILPEALFAWGVGVHDGGDLVSNVIGLFTGEDYLPKSLQPKSEPRPELNRFYQQHGSGGGGKKQNTHPNTQPIKQQMGFQGKDTELAEKLRKFNHE